MPASAHELEWDVIVVGSGAAGLSAALAAAVDGAKVIVLEKAPVLGGTTAMSSAGTWVPANHHMLAAGLTDVGALKDDLVTPTGMHGEPPSEVCPRVGIPRLPPRR